MISSLYILAGICAYVSFLHLLFAKQTHIDRVQLTFGLSALCVAAWAISQAQLQVADTPERYAVAWRVSLVSAIAAYAFVFGFVALYYASKRKPKDRMMGMAFGVFVAFSAEGLLSRLSLIPFPPLEIYGFLALVLAWSIVLRAKERQQLNVAHLVFDSSSEAIFVSDAKNNIVTTNPAFTKITGYSQEEVAGKNPRMLSMGRHDKSFYQSMWGAIQTQGKWSGEVWNRRKSGEVFAESLSIRTVKDAAGDVTHYVAAFTDSTEHKKVEETIHNLAFYDALTGLPNRRLLMERLRQALVLASRKHERGAILFIDLNDFKTVNDTQGHEVGDLLLIEIARRIQACTHSDDTLSRFGGDVYAVVINNLGRDIPQAALEAESVAKRISSRIKEPLRLKDAEYYCQVCIGIAMYGEPDDHEDELLKQVDAAMFQAKHMGRDSISFFDSRMQAALEARVTLESWLHKAIPEQLRLFYQVQVDQHGQPLGAEALIRWQHPEQGLVSPGQFIPVAEARGLILPIGRWVLETACQQLKAWESDASKCHLVLAVNVSAVQFQQADFVAEVMQILEQTQANPCRLKIELTESMLLENVDAIVAKMSALRQQGVQLSLDDFGTGFSSLAYLKRLPLDQLKIDQSFVRDLTSDPHDVAIVRTIIALGQGLGLGVIAEGVETEAQKNLLMEHGCHQFQGYFFGKPTPLEIFEQALNQREPRH